MNTTTVEIVSTAVATPSTAAKKPIQITCGIRKEEKDLVKEFCEELTRIGSQDKVVGANEKEVIEIALKIATDHRFFQEMTEEESIQENPETGEVEIVPPSYVWRDRFEDAWNEIKIRDYSTPVVRTNKVVENLSRRVDGAVNQLRTLYKAQGMTDEAIEAQLVASGLV